MLYELKEADVVNIRNLLTNAQVRYAEAQAITDILVALSKPVNPDVKAAPSKKTPPASV